LAGRHLVSYLNILSYNIPEDNKKITVLRALFTGTPSP
jgi:hypothetical protein